MWVHSAHINAYFLLLHCAGSHRIRDNGENKSVEFGATVSFFFYSCEIYTCLVTFSRYQGAQGSLVIV